MFTVALAANPKVLHGACICHVVLVVGVPTVWVGKMAGDA